MKKTHLIIVNIILLLWYFLSMIGLKIGDKYLVTGVFEEEWLFMLIPTITFVLMLVTKNVGRNRKTRTGSVKRRRKRAGIQVCRWCLWERKISAVPCWMT